MQLADGSLSLTDSTDWKPWLPGFESHWKLQDASGGLQPKKQTYNLNEILKLLDNVYHCASVCNIYSDNSHILRFFLNLFWRHRGCKSGLVPFNRNVRHIHGGIDNSGLVGVEILVSLRMLVLDLVLDLLRIGNNSPRESKGIQGTRIKVHQTAR